MRKLLLSILIFPLSSYSSVLPDGHKALRVDYTIGNADDLYVGEKKTKIQDATGNPERNIKNIGFAASFGIGSSSQIDLGIVYSDVDLGNGSDRTGVSEVLLKYTYNVFSNEFFDFDVGVGSRSAGDNRSGDNFIALNDGQTKYDFYLGGAYRFQRFSFNVNSRLTSRPNSGSKSQQLYEFSIAYLPLDKLQIATFYQIFNTSEGGLDIGATNFGGKFSQVAEEYTSIGGIVGYQIASQHIVDARYGVKIDGRNTDANKTLTLGYTFLLD